MELFQVAADKLDQLGIDYQLVEHPPALTTEEADAYIEGKEGVRTKTMFLTNKKKTQFYLLIMDDAKPVDLNAFKEIIGANKVRMASEESLKEKMSMPPGVVSPFGLLFNDDKDIKVYFDQEIKDEPIMTFHPNTNEKTIFIKTQDLYKYLEAIDYDYEIVEVPRPVDM